MDDQLTSAFLKVPANQYFGFQLVSCSLDGASLSMVVKPEHLQEEGVLHGGIISALADSTAVYAFYPFLEKNRTMTSIEFKLNFLNAAFWSKGEVVARSKILKRGKRVGVCEVEVIQGERTIAKGIFTYLFFER